MQRTSTSDQHNPLALSRAPGDPCPRGFLMLCTNMAKSQSSHSPQSSTPVLPQSPEHPCLQLLEGHSPYSPQPRAAPPGCHPHSRVLDTECSVHSAAKQNKTGFLHFPTQLPRLALFPVLIFVHILVLFYGRTPWPVPTCSHRVCQAGRQGQSNGSSGGSRQGP